MDELPYADDAPLFPIPPRTGIRDHGDAELVRPEWLADGTEVWAPIYVGDERAWVQCVAFEVTARDALVVSATPIRVYEVRVKLRDLRVPRCSPFAEKV